MIAGELVARVRADLTALDRDLAEGERKLSQFGRGTSAAGLDQFVARAQVSAQSAATSAQAAAQAVASSVQGASQQASAAIGNIATTAGSVGPMLAQSLTPLTQNLSGVSQAAEVTASATSTMASAAINAAGSVNELAARKADLLARLLNVQGGITGETRALADAQMAVTQFGTSHTQLNAAVQDSQIRLAGFLQQQSALKGELAGVNAALRAETTAQAAASAAAGVAANTTGELAAKTGFFNRILTTHTSQISTSGTIFKGYDNVLQAVIRSMGGVSVVGALLISVGGALAAKFLSLGRAKQELTTLGKELIDTDATLAAVFQQMAAAAETGNLSLHRQAVAFRELLSGVDISALIVATAEAIRVSGEHAANAERSLTSYGDAKAATERITQQLNQTTGLEIDSLKALRDSLVIVEGQTKRATDTVAIETAARDKANKTIVGNIETIRHFMTVTGQSADQVLAQAEALGVSGNAFLRLRAEVEAASSAIARYNAAVRAFRVPDLDIKATTEGLAAARQQIASTIQDLRQGGKAQAEIVAATRAQIDQYKKALQERIAIDAQVRGETLKQADAQRVLSQAMRDSGPEISAVGTAVIGAEKNLKAFSDSTKKAGAGAGVARSAFNAFADSSVGLSQAVAVVQARLGDAKLFDPVAKKARAASQEIKRAFDEVADVVESFLRDQGAKIDVTAERLARLSPAISKPLIDTAVAMRRVKDAIEQINFDRVANKLPPLADNIRVLTRELGQFKSFRLRVQELEVDFNTFAALPKPVIDVIRALGIQIRTTFPEADQHLNHSRTIAEQSGQAMHGAMTTASQAVDRFGEATERAANTTRRQFPSLDNIMKDIRDSIEFNLATSTRLLEAEVAGVVGNTISHFERLGSQLDLTGRALVNFVNQNVRQALGNVEGINQATIDRVIGVWLEADLANVIGDEFADMVAAILKSLGKLQTDAIRSIGAVARVFATLPDAIGGRVVNRVLGTINEWVRFGNSILTVFRDVIGVNLPATVGDAIGKVIAALGGGQAQAAASTAALNASVQSLTPAIQQLTSAITALNDKLQNTANVGQQVSTTLDKVGQSASGAANKATTAASQTAKGWQTAVTAIGAAAAGIMGVMGAMQVGGIRGGIQGGLSGMAAGAAIGSLFGPGPGTAIGAAIGGAAGFLAGIFGGKSALQKAQEAAALQQAKDAVKLSQQQVLQAAEATKQSILQTAQSVSDLLENISTRVKLPKDVIKGFIEDLDRLLRALADGLLSLADRNYEKLKAVSEGLKPAVELATSMPLLFEGISRHIPVAEADTTRFLDDFARVLTALGEKAKEIPVKLQKAAKDLGARVTSAVELVSAIPEALSNIAAIPPVTTTAIERLGTGLESILTVVQGVFEKFDRFKLKVSGATAEFVAPIVDFIKNVSETLRAGVDQQMPSESDWVTLFEGARRSFRFALDFFNELINENLTRARALSEQGSPILSFINALFGTFRAGREAGPIGSFDFDAIRAQARGLLQAAIDLASEISAEAAAAGARLAEAAGNIPGFIGDLAGAIRDIAETSSLGFSAEGFRQQGRALLQAVIDLATDFSTEGVEAGRRFADSARTIAEFTSTLGNAFQAVREGGLIGSQTIDFMFRGFEQVINTLASLRERISAGAIQAATSIAQETSLLFSLMQQSANSIKSISEMKVGDFTALVASVVAAVSALQQMVSNMLTAQSLSVSFRDAAFAVRDNVAAGVAALAQALAAGATSSATSAKLAIGQATKGASTDRVIRKTGTGSGITGGPSEPNSITVHVTVQGSLIEQSKLEDAIIKAIETATRRGRLLPEPIRG